MNRTKVLFLFLALILPVCIFIFLRIFGKNEFNVDPLFADSVPSTSPDCPKLSAPYLLHDSIVSQLHFDKDSILVIEFGDERDPNTVNQLNRIKAEISNLDVNFLTLSRSERHLFWKRCVFLLNDPQDLVVVDAKGQIRGQYTTADREEVDRLLTELTIILKRY